MIKTLTKIFAFTAVTKSLLETKKSQSAGTTQIHPSKIPGRTCLLYTSPSPRDVEESRMPSSA